MLVQQNYETMQIERRDNGIAVVTHNRPERLNAVNGRMHAQMGVPFQELRSKGAVLRHRKPERVAIKFHRSADVGDEDRDAVERRSHDSGIHERERMTY